MPNSHRIRSTGVAAMALAALTVAGGAVSTAHAAPVATRVADQAVPPVCTWRSVSSAAKGSAAYLDGAVTVWTTYYLAHRGLLLHVQGQFPYARGISFSTQPVSMQDDGSLVFMPNGGDQLYDSQLKADGGNVNPFLPGADHQASKRHYSLWLRPQTPTSRKGNEMFIGASGLGALQYRVYAPDKGRNAQGGVPLPTIDKVVVYGDGSKPTVVHVPACSDAKALRAAVVGQRFATTATGWPALTWHHAAAASTAVSDSGLSYDALAARITSSAGYDVLRFKAPTFAQTYTGHAITGHEQVRYWSVCAYDLASARLTGCVADDQSHLDKNGYATIVLTTAANRPAPAALTNADWLPLGTNRQSVLMYRQLWAASNFAQAIQRATGNGKQMQARMGAYYPTLVSCNAARWSKNRCAG